MEVSEYTNINNEVFP